VTESADQEHASPSSTLPVYVFQGPAQVAIRTRTNDQPKYVDTRLSAWTWYDGGIAMTIDWAALQLNSELIEIGKGFMAYALEKYAPRTAVRMTAAIPCPANSDCKCLARVLLPEPLKPVSHITGGRSANCKLRTAILPVR